MSRKKVASSRKRRTVTWVSPGAVISAPGTSGLDWLRGLQDGRIPRPPVWSLVDLRLTAADTGRVTVEVTPQEFHYNRFGVVQGGIAATILDAAIACAVTSVLPAGSSFTSLDLKVNYMKPISIEAGTMRCEAAVISAGRRIVVAGARLVDAQDRLYADAMATCMVLNAKA